MKHMLAVKCRLEPETSMGTQGVALSDAVSCWVFKGVLLVYVFFFISY